MIKKYRCWKQTCKAFKENRWFKKKELIKRVEGDKLPHIDYCCPICEGVIICCS